MTGGTSHSSIRPTSDIGRLLIRANPFHAGEWTGRGDESPRYHSFPPAGQFAPPVPPQNRKATRGSSADGPSIFFSPDSGFAGVRPTCARHFYCLPASLSARRRKRGGGSDDDDQEQRVHLVFTSLRLIRSSKSLIQSCVPDLPASLATRGRKRRSGCDHDQQEKCAHWKPRFDLESVVCFGPSEPPTAGRKSSRRAICNWSEYKGCSPLSDSEIGWMRIARLESRPSRGIDNKRRLFSEDSASCWYYRCLPMSRLLDS